VTVLLAGFLPVFPAFFSLPTLRDWSSLNGKSNLAIGQWDKWEDFAEGSRRPRRATEESARIRQFNLRRALSFCFKGDYNHAAFASIAVPPLFQAAASGRHEPPRIRAAPA
jgi:hypothetical protein